MDVQGNDSNPQDNTRTAGYNDYGNSPAGDGGLTYEQITGAPLYGQASRDVFKMPTAKNPGDGIDMGEFKLGDYVQDFIDEHVIGPFARMFSGVGEDGLPLIATPHGTQSSRNSSTGTAGRDTTFKIHKVGGWGRYHWTEDTTMTVEEALEYENKTIYK